MSNALPRQGGDDRRRKATIRFHPQIAWSARWPELDAVSGESGTGFFKGLRVWWSVRRGTWVDDWPFAEDFWPEEVRACQRCGLTDGHEPGCTA